MPAANVCSVRGCFKRPQAKGMCASHYRAQLKARKPPCSIPECGRRSYAAGVCRWHRVNGGAPIKPIRPRGPKRQRAWGQLWLQATTVRWLAAEARRRGVPPTGLMADLLDELARRA